MDPVQTVLGLVCIGAIKYLDLTDPDTIFFVRLAYAAGTLLTLLSYALLYQKINGANEQQELIITQGDLNPQPPLAGMLGAPQSPDANKPTTITIKDYDLMKLGAALKSTVTQVAITVALHMWKGFMPPLVFQSVMAVAGVMNSELAKIHFFNNNPNKVPELKRPWKPASPFAAFKELKKEMSQLSAQDNKPARKNKAAQNKLSVNKKSK